MAQRYLEDLSPLMQRCLVRAAAQGIKPAEVGESIHPRTMAALERRKLIFLTRNRKGRQTWRPTDAGRTMVSMHTPRYLHRRSNGPRQVPGMPYERSGYTSHSWQAMWGEPEVME